MLGYRICTLYNIKGNLKSHIRDFFFFFFLNKKNSINLINTYNIYFLLEVRCLEDSFSKNWSKNFILDLNPVDSPFFLLFFLESTHAVVCSTIPNFRVMLVNFDQVVLILKAASFLKGYKNNKRMTSIIFSNFLYIELFRSNKYIYLFMI